MNLYKFKYFTYVYLIILMLTIWISVFIKKYDFLLGMYIFTVPVLVIGFITIWLNNRISKQTIQEKLVTDFLLHWIPFLSFIYIVFVIQPKINNKLLFWIGYILTIIYFIIYFTLIGGKKGIENNYNLSFSNIVIIYISVLLLSTIITYYKLS